MAGPGYKELGGAGTPIYGGVIYDEYLYELTGPNGLLIYDRMRRSDARCASTLRMLKLPVLQAQWVVQPSEDDEDLGEEIALFVDRVLKGMTYTWAHTLAQGLLMLDYGFIPLEKVWELRDRPPALKGTKAPSKCVWLRKLAPRLPTTIQRWVMDAKGSLEAIEQALPDGSGATIPVEKLVVLTNDKEGDNWEGRSILRSAYKHWYIKDHLEKVDAIGHERTALGVPVWDLNATEIDLNSLEGMALIQRCEDIAKALQAHEEQYVIETAGAKFRFEVVNRTNSSLLETIKHHEMCLAANVMSEFMMLGVTGAGSRAVAKEQRGPFELALLSVASNLAETLEKFVVEPLVIYNYGERAGYPTLEAKGIQDADLKPLADMVSTLVEKGVIQPDPGLEDYLRDILELPALDREEMPEVPEEPEAPEVPEEPEEPEAPETPGEVPEERETSPPGQPGAEEHSEPRPGDVVPFVDGSPPKPTWWRAPTDGERYVDFEALRTTLDDSKASFIAELKAALKPLTDDLAYSLAQEVVEGKVTPGMSKPPASITKTARAILQRVAASGKSSVYDEHRRAKAGMPVARRKMLIRESMAEVELSDKLQQWLTSTADHAAQSIWRTAESAALNRALHDIKVVHHLDELLEQEMAGLVETLDSSVAKSALAESVAVIESFSAGRGEGIVEQVENDWVSYGLYSALLDDATCDACMKRDGEEYEPGSIEFQQFMDGNSDECAGQDYCRCMLALVYKDEERGRGVGGIPVSAPSEPILPEPSPWSAQLSFPDVADLFDPDRLMEAQDGGLFDNYFYHSISMTERQEMKERIQKDLSDRLMTDPRFRPAVDAAHARDIAENPYNAMFDKRAFTENRVRNYVSQWAASSGDSQPLSLVLQRAVAEEFGLTDDFAALLARAEASNPGVTAIVDAEFAKDGDLVRSFVQAMYDSTQERLASRGIDNVLMYRGVHGEEYAGQVSGLFERASFSLQPASSFSIDPIEATNFGYGDMLMFTMVPRERILSTAGTGFGCLNEYEYVVLAGRAEGYALRRFSNYGFARSYVGYSGRRELIESLAQWEDAVESSGGSIELGFDL